MLHESQPFSASRCHSRATEVSFTAKEKSRVGRNKILHGSLCSCMSKQTNKQTNKILLFYWVRRSTVRGRHLSTGSTQCKWTMHYISQNALGRVRGYLDMCSSPQQLQPTFTKKYELCTNMLWNIRYLPQTEVSAAALPRFTRCVWKTATPPRCGTTIPLERVARCRWTAAEDSATWTTPR